MARPRKADRAALASETVTLKLSPQLRQGLKGLAEAAGLSVSEYLRRHIESALVGREFSPPEPPAARPVLAPRAPAPPVAPKKPVIPPVPTQETVHFEDEYPNTPREQSTSSKIGWMKKWSR